jgi:hypothetical protein
MASIPTASSRTEVIEGASRVLVGGGVVTLGLFPLALPLILLLVAAAIPFIVLGLGLALVVAVLAAPLLLVRRALRRASEHALTSDAERPKPDRLQVPAVLTPR